MTRSSRSPTLPTPSGATVSGGLLAVAVALLVVRWLIPAEAAESGQQLWLTAAWSLLAGGWLWFSPSPRSRWDWVDACVALMIVGHELSGLFVFVTGGQLRFAANLMCEWWGLACVWIVLRDVMSQPGWCDPVRRALLATAATVACLGIYQHYWGLPQSVRELVPLIEKYRAGDNLAAVELLKLGVPTSEPGLTLYEKRLRDSAPFAFFALTNTLGGLLAASLVWGLAGTVLVPPFQGGWLGGRRVFLPLMVLAWCLALTKGRTAWVGAVCGMAFLGWLTLRSKSQDDSKPNSSVGKWIAACVVGCGLLLAAIWGLMQSGGLDAQVLLESAKSLSYRGQYWIGTGRLIAESPMFGRGLGQFREHYLRVKLPEASEEIADPHNLILDAWVNGGLCGVVGLLGLVLAVARAARRSGSSWGAAEVASNASPTKFVFIGGVLGFVAAFLAGLWLDGGWDDRYLVLGVVWCMLFWLLPQSGVTTTGTVAAVVTLGVHLLGAGGLGMPSVMQMAFVWLAGATATNDTMQNMVTGRRRFLALIPTVGGLVIALFVWLPVVSARHYLERGDEFVRRSDMLNAGAAYLRANEEDPWDPTPLGRLAEWEFDLWGRMTPEDRRYQSADSGPFSQALQHFQEARLRDRHSVAWLRRMAEMWLALFDRSHEAAHAARAAELFCNAAARYPTNAELLAQWSDSAVHAGDMAASTAAARRALTQDDLNRRLGHVERVLQSAVRLRLEQRGGE